MSLFAAGCPLIELNPDFSPEGSSTQSHTSDTGDAVESLSTSISDGFVSGTVSADGSAGATGDSGAVSEGGNEGEGGGLEGCVELFVDEFDDGVIDEAWTVEGTVHEVSEEQSELLFHLGPGVEAVTAVSHEFVLADGERIVFEVGAPPPADDEHAQLLIGVDLSPGPYLQWKYNRGQQYVRNDATPTPFGSEYVFLAVSRDGEQVSWSTSTDGQDWTTAHTETDPELDGPVSCIVYLMGQTWTAGEPEVVTSVASVRHCAA